MDYGLDAMISLILPYWDRQEAANKALELIAKHYRTTNLEVIVVDDGNKVPFVKPKLPIDIQVVRRPEKPLPTPQSKAWNAGVKAAHGDIIALSCIEVLHEAPILAGLAKHLEAFDYVLAATYCPEFNEWQCKSDKQWVDLPMGIGPGFLGLMRRETFEKIGGFDESYHEGAGYEDRDFARRVLKSGAKVKICDDLVVIHPKTGATIHWPQEGFIRNEQLYRSKWMTPINVVCLKAGKAYDPEYVNILFDMVRRNLPAGYPGKFYCITDDEEGLNEGIEVIHLPQDLETWWGKLYMFKRGLFPDGSRCLFFDLDTLIIGDLSRLVSYSGGFATLRDFYHPERLGPAIIAWEAGRFSSRVWEQWESQGKPRHQMGDLWWLNTLDGGNFAKQVDILQDQFPGEFCSFKADCHPYPPNGTRIVCFHGQPKPENCGREWVSQVWKVGGSGMAELEVVANTSNELVKSNVLSACKRDVPWLEILPENASQAVIVSGGPSIKNTLIEIRARYDSGQTIFAVNGSANWLNDHGMVPDYHVVIDARPENIKFLEALSCGQLLASQCDPSLFDKAQNATLFHLNTEGIADILPKDREANLISSGTTVGLAAMALAYCLGYRVIHLHGFDSSYEESHHAYEQKQNDADPVIDAVVNDRTFKCAPWMVTQAQQFQELATQLANAGVVVTVAGDGLLPYIAKCMSLTGAKE